MRRAFTALIGSALLAVSIAAQAPPEKVTRNWTVPRTADGRPDFSGVWANNSVTPLERPKQWEGKTRLTDAELEQLKREISQVYDEGGDAIFQNVVEAALERRKLVSYDPSTGNYNQFWMVEREIDARTSLVTDPPDGRIPALTPEAQARRGALRSQTTVNEGGPAGRANGPEDRPASERCITFGAPNTFAGYNSYFQFVQSPTTVGILQELIHAVRTIPIHAAPPHLTPSVRQWHGDSRGHWDGDALVVETRNYSPKFLPQGATDGLKTLERFTRVGLDYINWEITYDDPATWTRPWTMMIRLKKESKEVYEYACHESNHSMVGILAGARARERAMAAGRAGAR